MDSSISAASRKRYREGDDEYDGEYDEEDKRRGVAPAPANPPKWLGEDMNNLILTFNYCIDNMEDLVPDLFDKHVWRWLKKGFFVNLVDPESIAKELYQYVKSLFTETLRRIEDNFKRDQENRLKGDNNYSDEDIKKHLDDMFIHRMHEGRDYFYEKITNKYSPGANTDYDIDEIHINFEHNVAWVLESFEGINEYEDKFEKDLDDAIMLIFKMCKKKYDLLDKPNNPTYNLDPLMEEKKSNLSGNDFRDNSHEWVYGYTLFINLYPEGHKLHGYARININDNFYVITKNKVIGREVNGRLSKLNLSDLSWKNIIEYILEKYTDRQPDNRWLSKILLEDEDIEYMNNQLANNMDQI